MNEVTETSGRGLRMQKTKILENRADVLARSHVRCQLGSWSSFATCEKLQIQTNTNLYSNLYIIGWIPVNIKEDKPRCSNQIQSHSTSFRTQQKYNCTTKEKADIWVDTEFMRSMYYREAFPLKSVETVCTEAFFNFIRLLVRIGTRLGRSVHTGLLRSGSRTNTRLTVREKNGWQQSNLYGSGHIYIFYVYLCFMHSRGFNNLTRGSVHWTRVTSTILLWTRLCTEGPVTWNFFFTSIKTFNVISH